MTDSEGATFLDRTLLQARRTWDEIVSGASSLVDGARARVGRIPPDVPDSALSALKKHMDACLGAPGGEVSARARTAELGRIYLDLSSEGRTRFLNLLAEDYGIDDARVMDAIAAYTSASGTAISTEKQAAAATLRTALKTDRMKLLTMFSTVPRGVKFLVDMRADLLAISGRSPALAALNDDLKGLLASWFDFGFLDLARISWDSPASLLEKLIAYEAVHEIRSWDDLRNRLDSDRRCYALFHPRMPDEPLAFVEVALVKGMSGNVQALLDEDAPLDDLSRADTAIFYSISNTQRGLRGISFGEYLIKRAVSLLSSEMPQLKTFATLSPVPGFKVWLDACLERDGAALLTPDERKELSDHLPDHLPGHLAEAKESDVGLAHLIGRVDWHVDLHGESALREALEGPLIRLLARYFSESRSDGKPIDPVARFHLRNGARLERLNWLGDTSAKGLRQALGFMVNYRYLLDDIDDNHEAYERGDEIVTTRTIRDLMRKGDGKTRSRLARFSGRRERQPAA